MELSLCAVVTLYNPEQVVLDNIRSYLPYVEKLYIMDNTDKDESSSWKMFLLEKLHTYEHKLVYLNFGTNLGISKAINVAVNNAKEDGFSYILMMDQDSSFDKSQIENYLQYITTDMKMGLSFCLYGPSRKKVEDVEYEIDIPIMTSGSIVSIEKFIEAGGYNENLFIDEVDHEFSLKILDLGYKIKKFGNVRINHFLGEDTAVKKIVYRKYPPFRYYYFTRNYFYLKKHYSQLHLDFILVRRRQLLIKIRNILKYGSNRVDCLFFVFLGWFHSKIGRWGKGISF